MADINFCGTNLNVPDIARYTTPEKENSDEKNIHLHAAGDAINFLAKEGFLTHIGPYIDGSNLPKARLTPTHWLRAT